MTLEMQVDKSGGFIPVNVIVTLPVLIIVAGLYRLM
jgi:hypothetical protein